MDRRRFLGDAAAATGALVVGVNLPGCSLHGVRGDAEVGPFVRVDSHGLVTVRVPRAEMGQDVLTAVAQLVAEELEADWALVRAEPAPVDAERYGRQVTVASVSVHRGWFAFREAGAQARDLLVRAAALRWGVPATECHARLGEVLHAGSGRVASFGALAPDAARLKVADPPPLKDPAGFTIAGRSLARLDGRAKVTGRAIYGIDVTVPGLRYATVIHAPVIGEGVGSFDDSATRRIPGVLDVVRVEPDTTVAEGRRVQVRGGVAVIANDSWTALRGARALEIDWTADASTERLSERALFARLGEALDGNGISIVRRGDPQAALDSAARRFESEFSVPYLAHATMEPMNCTVHVETDRCRLWVPTQAPTAARALAAALTGRSPDRVVVTPTFMGGGFGRRSDLDYVAEALVIGRRFDGPVKVFWSREEDIRQDYYRPASVHRLRAGVDEIGRLTVWEHDLVTGGSIERRLFTDFRSGDVDWTATLGAHRIPYAVESYTATCRMPEIGIPTGFHRSIGHGSTCFANEVFIDEICTALGRDPFRFRRGLLPEGGRAQRTLDTAARAGSWDAARGAGVGRGMALFAEERGRDPDRYRVYVAVVARVLVSGSDIVVEKIDCAVDVGFPVNPDGVRAQIEGGIVFGLSGALRSRITLRGGVPVEGNFDSFRVLRMRETPPIDVHLVRSSERPSGVGEKGVPAVAPAVANAVFDATGARLRHLPLQL